jgi:hypothetical protein
VATRIRAEFDPPHPVSRHLDAMVMALSIKRVPRDRLELGTWLATETGAYSSRMAKKLVTQTSAVFSAIKEFDSLGRSAFLAKYGFGKAKNFFLVHEGERYDSKAIYGAAFGFENPDFGHLTSNDFSGGEAQVASRLRQQLRALAELGFVVVQHRRDGHEQMLQGLPRRGLEEPRRCRLPRPHRTAPCVRATEPRYDTTRVGL